MQFTLVIEGNLTEDPKLRTTDSGHTLCNLRVAHNTRRFVKGEWQDSQPIFLTVTCWAKLAENVAKLRKGDPVIVDCRNDLHAEVYRDTAYLRVTANNVAVSMRRHEAASLRQRIPAAPTADTVVTAEGEHYDADSYAEHATEHGLTAVG